jgi:hypothetical protein
MPCQLSANNHNNYNLIKMTTKPHHNHMQLQAVIFKNIQTLMQASAASKKSNGDYQQCPT